MSEQQRKVFPRPATSTLTPPVPYWQTTDGESVKLYYGDVIDTLNRLPSKSVHCVVTSPPYWGLRKYKTGDDPREIGCEPTLEQFVERMVTLGKGIRRVLRDDGTFWLNLGDTYVDGRLQGVPWMVALALAKGPFVLRQEIIWAKRNPMPDSVRNRCTKAHEQIFLFTKGSDYFYDNIAIKEHAIRAGSIPGGDYNSSSIDRMVRGQRFNRNGIPLNQTPVPEDRNKRSVWFVDDEEPLTRWLAENHPQALQEYLKLSANKTDVWRLSTKGYRGAHFATYPPKLIEPCIKAGTSEKGCCGACGSPYKRVVERIGGDKIKGDSGQQRDRSFRHSRNGVDSTLDSEVATFKTLGWEPTCPCNEGESEIVPCTVLDPFMGSGTTAEVAIKLGRRCWGIDLSEEYLKKCAIPRVEGVLFSQSHTRDLVPQRQSKPIKINSMKKRQ